jgi:hypothetical protein
VGEGVAAGEHRGRVELGGGAGQPAQRGGGVAGAQQRLRRHARPVRALAADELRLDHHDGQSGAVRVVRGVLTDGTGAHDDDVELVALRR